VPRDVFGDGLRGDLIGDVTGGLTAGVLTLVTTLAYVGVAGAIAVAAGLGDGSAMVSGLIGAVVGGLVAALLSPLGVQVHGPRASVVVVIAAAGMALSGTLQDTADAATQTLAWLSVCLLLAAALQVLFGMLRLGVLIRLVPHSVTAGFTLGVAASLAWSQRELWWPDGAAGSTGTLVVVAATALVVVALRHQQRWRALRGASLAVGFLLAVAACAAAAASGALAVQHLPALDLSAAPFVAASRLSDIGSHAAGDGFVATLPRLLPQVILHAFVIAFVNSLESLTCAMALESRLLQRADPNRLLIASGAGSFVAVVAGGLPVAGGAAASFANLEAGARTRRSAFIAAATVALSALAAHALLARLPLPALGAITLTAALAMAGPPLRDLAQTWRRAQREQGAGWIAGESVIAVLVLALLLAFGSAVALVAGVLAAALLAVLRLRRGVVERVYTPGEAALRVVEVGQPLLFANVEMVVSVIDAQAASARCVVVDLSRASTIDASAARTVAHCAASWEREQVVVRLVLPTRAASPAFEGCSTFDRLDDALRAALATPVDSPVAEEPAPRLLPGLPLDDATSPEQRATQLLLPLVGPIAPLLVERAQRDGPSTEQLRERLAAHLSDAQARQRFLSAMAAPSARPLNAPAR
jgi:MFS superfamily sulfate permease-like transporter